MSDFDVSEAVGELENLVENMVNAAWDAGYAKGVDCSGPFRSELEARYHKAQAEAWKNRARQLKGDNLMLHDKVEMLHRHLARYRHKVTALKEENERLREKLARYRELEPVTNGGK